MKPHIFIIGSPSLDQLTLKGRTHHSVGGAGLYTALAAVQSGAHVTLFAPKPNPLPPEFEFIEKYIHWIGPEILPENVPRFHIQHGKKETKYTQAFFGAEETLSPKELPHDLSHFSLIHCVPLGNAKTQLRFIESIKKRGARVVSAGTALSIIENDPDAVQQVYNQTDLFFMNQQEAEFLSNHFNITPQSPKKILLTTHGEDGVLIQTGDFNTHIASYSSNVLDPTGAGDTFCGTVLAELSQGNHPVMSAKKGAQLSATMIQGIGPEKLLNKSQTAYEDSEKHVSINKDQVRRIASLITNLDEAEPYNFIGPSLPPENYPHTLDFFFVTTLQQFSFWEEHKGQYKAPLIGTMDGQELKGAFYLFQAYWKRLQDNPDFFTPEQQARQSRGDMIDLFKSDHGEDLMPALDLHLEMAHAYGNTMLTLGWTPENILQMAQSSDTPLKTFLQLLDFVGGYREDPLRKKSALLALILEQRPEHFLSFGKREQLPPVIDYHCMRANLRLGMVDIINGDLQKKLRSRGAVSAEEEWAVRHKVYEAVALLPELSGRSMGTVDWFFFMSRKRCPEMTEPLCSICPADSVCAQRTELFQPVIRTSFY